MNRDYRKKWIITHEKLPAVLRRCSKCGRKTEFENSGKFRVNANGGLLDVWMIYRCSRCETTWNLAVYERTEVSSLDENEYRGFMENRSSLAEKYGSRKKLFAEKKAELAAGPGGFSVQILDTPELCEDEAWNEVEIHLAACLQPRIDALFAGELGFTRTRVKDLCRRGLLREAAGTVKAGDRVRDGQVFYIKKEAKPQPAQTFLVKKCI